MAAAGGGEKQSSRSTNASGDRFYGDSKGKDVRSSNIVAAKGSWFCGESVQKSNGGCAGGEQGGCPSHRVVGMRGCSISAAVADAIRTSLGPKGMDKMIQGQDGEVIITNDGATIMTHMQVFHPTAKMLVELSRSQDVEAGDGTTSVVVLAGSLLDECGKLLAKGIHPTMIADAFQLAARKSSEVLESIATPVLLSDREQLIRAATTSMASKVVSQHSDTLAPLAVDAVMSVIDPDTATNVDLRDVKVVKAMGGTVDDTELVHGLVFNRKASHTAGAPTHVRDAKIGLVQFCLSAPKTDMENTVVVNDHQAMDRILKEERKYVLKMCKKIQQSGCNVVLVQKSILRDAVNDLSLHFLSKMNILVVKDVEREDIDFISRTIGCRPIADIDSFVPEKLGSAELVREVDLGGGHKTVQVTGVANPGRTVSLLVRGSNKLVLDEAERSLHDALCVVRSLVKRRFMLPGGGAPETEVALALSHWSHTLSGMDAYCVRAFAEAMEVAPYTLAENAGMHPIHIVTELRRQHAAGNKTAGINVRRGMITDILEENVLQPLLVTESAIQLATETVRMILKIDDIVITR